MDTCKRLHQIWLVLELDNYKIFKSTLNSWNNNKILVSVSGLWQSINPQSIKYTSRKSKNLTYDSGVNVLLRYSDCDVKGKKPFKDEELSDQSLKDLFSRTLFEWSRDSLELDFPSMLNFLDTLFCG